MVDFLTLLIIVDTFFEVVVIFISFTFSHIINVFIIEFFFFHLVIFHTILPLSFFFLKVIPYSMNFLINLFTLEPIFFLLFPTIFIIDRVSIISLFTFVIFTFLKLILDYFIFLLRFVFFALIIFVFLE